MTQCKIKLKEILSSHRYALAVVHLKPSLSLSTYCLQPPPPPRFLLPPPSCHRRHKSATATTNRTGLIENRMSVTDTVGINRCQLGKHAYQQSGFGNRFLGFSCGLGHSVTFVVFYRGKWISVLFRSTCMRSNPSIINTKLWSKIVLPHMSFSHTATSCPLFPRFTS